MGRSVESADTQLELSSRFTHGPNTLGRRVRRFDAAMRASPVGSS
ncbi:MAG: hypothetical protein ACLFNC_00750 [Halodesulfurarchaeum sp.]